MVESVVEDLARKRLGRTIKGKWRLDRLIGVGGMAAVYAATHRNGARVAIKMLHATISASQQIRARFIREGYLANKVDHHGVVRVLDDDVDDTDQSAFLVMDLIVGTTLAERAMERLLDAGEVLAVAEQVLQVLQAAHDKGIVHRDLKPDNLLVDREGKIHVLDFGIARLLDDMTGGVTSTKTGTAFGTPGFMAPEQALGKTQQISARTDIYALGATLFALACGDFVHAAENPQELLILVATQPPRSLAELAPTMHADVVAIIDKATRNVADARWQSAAEMLAAVRAAREKLGVPQVRVLPLTPGNATPTTLEAVEFEPSRSNPELAAPVLARPERMSSPDEMIFSATSPSAPKTPVSARGSAPFAVPSATDPQLQRKPKFLPLAIIGGAAAIIGLVAIIAATGRRDPKPTSATEIEAPKAKTVETTPSTSASIEPPPSDTVTMATASASASPSVSAAKPVGTGKLPKNPKTPPPKGKGIDLGY